MDPMGEVLYVSDTSSRRVYRVRNLGQPKDPSRNLEVVAGTGEQCLPFDQSHCGEGRKAADAALNNPRGRTLYIYCKKIHFLWQLTAITHCRCELKLHESPLQQISIYWYLVCDYFSESSADHIHFECIVILISWEKGRQSACMSSHLIISYLAECNMFRISIVIIMGHTQAAVTSHQKSLW